MELSQVSTADLQTELSKREGIDTHRVNPYESFTVSVGEEMFSGTGPVVITVNRD